MKYFVCSDPHSHCKPLKESLEKAKFEINNKDHLLIICGDVFDRGDETLELYEFLKSINNKILIKGNHELLYLDLLNKSVPDSYDYSNGTVKTFCHIAGIDPEKMEGSYWYREKDKNNPNLNVRDMLYSIWSTVVEKVKNSEITEWIKSNEWVNFYELDRFIFVHSFIPMNYDMVFDYYKDNFRYNPDWRVAFDYEWVDAVWGCPYKDFMQGLFTPEIQKGKTLVCGHWHSFGFREYFGGFRYENEKDIDFSIYYSKYLIALDTCSILSKKVNVMVIENNVCYDENGNELKEEPMLEGWKKKIEKFERKEEIE